jgi:hypothetical protein
VPGYRAVKKLGEGTFGHVWLYEDERTGIQVAVKFFNSGRGERWQLVQAEVRQLAILHADPGIVQLVDVEPFADPPYYVMSYASGGSLARRLESGPVPVPEALRIFRGTVAALAYVHAKGIRHCDLKPGNVLLDARDRPLVADFGQAHLSDDASPALGTFFYMAPEQADLSRNLPDTRWDVYGLGALFYAMVTGGPPRGDSTLSSELAGTADLSHRLRRYREGVERAPRPAAHHRVPGMDSRLRAIIDRCLDLDPDRRWHDAGALLEALDRRERARRQRYLRLFGFLAPLLLLLAMGTGGILLTRGAVERAEDMLTDRLLENDRTTARLVASILDDELDDRIDRIEPCARDKALGRLLRDNPGDRAGLTRLLLRHKPRDEKMFHKWSLADRQGWMVADDPHDNPDLFKKRWAWRDWFNGEGHKWGQADASFPPLTRTHVSGPYQSREPGHPAIITISCPVPDPDGGPPVGVLVGSFHLEHLSRWLDKFGMDREKEAVVVLNHKRQYLLHRGEPVLPPPDRDPPAEEGLVFTDLIDHRHEGKAPEHRDPLDPERAYLAGYAPLEGDSPSGWGVVVQHDRAEALQSIEDLRGWLRRFGLWALLSAVGLTSALWGMLIWRLRHEELAPQRDRV